jgi:putative transposase
MGLDCERYVQLLRKYKMKFRVRIYAYCLIPTAAHLIVHPENAYMLPLFMQGIHQSYALFFRNRYNGTGKVWGQRYKSTLVNGDDDLFTRIKSIEFIPVKEYRSHSPVEYPWSSCADRVQGLSGIVDHLPADWRGLSEDPSAGKFQATLLSNDVLTL